ncbi:anaerobic ribonucleoside-triphosphate reductase activating protein [Campylobacter sp.]|uniref:anaerobic ribonucleoside-triphosphate reductase activating protein n=1 Tax=Campylobacter sp. TaxID=205 RepID=UPI00270F894F|nr:anaerobic ribonucleoside-triphosphate reductase activating protein [Campylobacter sp.]
MSAQNKPLHSITPFTTLDFPDKTACVAWFTGCNMRCAYCYNTAVVLGEGFVSEDEFLQFLDRRVGKLSGVVFSGGECTISESFLPLAREVKRRGFLLKVDTNGSNLKVLKAAIDENLIDYIALDFKAPREKFQEITKSNLYENFIQTLEFLISINFKFEVRTTVHADILSEDDISKMSKVLEKHGYNGAYYLQKFLNTGENFGNLTTPKREFDTSKIESNLKIELRNFA